ncbi:MAG TPA: sigma-70 family RNA polymerase sigma factor [Trebonia sp.]|jgi:RNA polymerase sigma-70 factor (TIGR02960 family)|nr:sigma-70 family RNA polymerase sigma factor [Trebonia sp.]
MTDTTLARARAGDEQAFRELTDPYRRELHVHCYRMLGSVQDAEDMLQETLLAAWRGLGEFGGRSSTRAWLYRIATNRCLNALRDAGRRPQRLVRLPPFEAPEPTRRTEPTWFEPYPDSLIEDLPDTSPGPEARYESRESLALAFVAGLQRLPPGQRAAFVLRDVLGFRAAEAADLLDNSEVSVNSALQRARAALDGQLPGRDRQRAPLPRSPRERALAGQFADAFENADVERIVALLTEDAWLTMPPEPLEYQGHAAITEFFLTRSWWGVRAPRLLPTRASGQPAFGYYRRDRSSPFADASGLIVLTLAGDRISAITRFHHSLFPGFGLPASLDD